MLKIHKYNPSYVGLFQLEKTKLSSLLKNAYTIEHIGSTAVPGLDGKGVIDIMVVFNDQKEITSAVEALKNAGYYLSEANEERGERVFMTTSGAKESQEGDIHLHLLTKDNPDYANATLFRDYLIKYPGTKKTYAELKYSLLNKTGRDRAKYTKQKDSFIKNTLDKAKQGL